MGESVGGAGIGSVAVAGVAAVVAVAAAIFALTTTADGGLTAPALLMGLVPIAALLAAFRSCARRRRLGTTAVVISASALTLWVGACTAREVVAAWAGVTSG